MSDTLLAVSPLEINNNKPSYASCVCKFADAVLKLYFICFCAAVVYYLHKMNGKLVDFNSKITELGRMGNCLFEDICHNSVLGSEMCGNCYTNMSLPIK